MADDKWLLLRGKLGDGTPDGTTPDIILGGRKPDPAYAQDYDKVFNQKGNFSATNYVFVRVKNAGAALAIGDLTVYVTHLADLPHQGKWTKLHTIDGRASTNIGADTGKVATNGAPLIWAPDGSPAPGAPYCLIAEVSGDGFPDIKLPASVTDQKSFDGWIATQSRLAYLVVKAPDVVVVPSPSFIWEGYVNFANANAAQLSSSLTCTSAQATGLLSYVFSEKDKSGSVIGVGEVEFQPNTSYSQNRTVPANFASKVTITYKPGSTGDASAQFTFQVTSAEADTDDDDMGTSHPTVMANYTLSFEQAVVAAG